MVMIPSSTRVPGQPPSFRASASASLTGMSQTSARRVISRGRSPKLVSPIIAQPLVIVSLSTPTWYLARKSARPASLPCSVLLITVSPFPVIADRWCAAVRCCGRPSSVAAEGAAVFRDVLAEDEGADAGEQVRRGDGEQGYEPAGAPGGGDGAVGEHGVVEAADAVGGREGVAGGAPPAGDMDQRQRAGAEEHHHEQDEVVDDLDALVDQRRSGDDQGQADGGDHDGGGGQQSRGGPVQADGDERGHDAVGGGGDEQRFQDRRGDPAGGGGQPGW